ncbi:MAG: glycosyltransferase family 4 protein [Bauldia sp.]|uniref:glycosyltransferase family 4 protein n=1 Tax=Bauldia sp. TaxID=2575872 RepID=UPI001D49F88B|nr:glycosyltransferase family 4 protein [Bauldia sp.]MCB1494937.1 glycosyltransferase family 4 protein [Bauldia sp.]
MSGGPWRIVHFFRAPVGGLFRHVRDLAEAQQDAGHAVGVICDATIGSTMEEHALDAIAPHLSLGLTRIPMPRQIRPSDIAATWRALREVRRLNPDILHGHGAKGGVYARTIGTLLRASGFRVARIYSPHGGSLHFDRNSLGGRAYLAAESVLRRMTDAFVFVSRFEADTYTSKVGSPGRLAVVVPNGLRAEEFDPVDPAPDAADFLFIGALRDLKGPDVFIEALAEIERTGKATPTALIVGDGPDEPRYRQMVGDLGLSEAVAFREPMPARRAFRHARGVIVPSRAESMPYIVLETIAAGMPLVATRVGGIPEIFGPEAERLVPPGDAPALAAAMARLRDDPATVKADSERLRDSVRARFSVSAMAAAVAEVYQAVTIPKE